MDIKNFASMFLAVAMIVTPVETIANNIQHDQTTNTTPPPSMLCTQRCRNNLGRGLNLMFQAKADDRRQKHITRQDDKIPSIVEMGIQNADILASKGGQITPDTHVLIVTAKQPAKEDTALEV